MREFSQPHVLKALGYAHAVSAGEIYACKWVRLACERQLRDLEREDAEAWQFRFDEELAGRACEFFEELPHTQGPLAFRREDGSWNTLVLEPWQCFIATTVYGWVRKDSPLHRSIRRFTRCYEEEPRGQGKSLRLSGALLYAFAENEQGVEAYSAAVDREQASKIYGEAIGMLRKRPELAQALRIEVSAHSIFQKATNSKAMPLSREAKKSGDGKNIAFAALDELHAHPTREVVDVIDSGTGKRGGNALVWCITTAGFDASGICYEKRDYSTKVLEGEIPDETWFAIIYTVDDPEKWTDEECRAACTDHSHPRCQWRCANPNWGVSVDPLDFESKMLRAIRVPSERNNLQTKHLCIWCSADTSWMDLPAWDACADATLREEDFAGKPCIVAIDMANKFDLVAKVKVFLRDFETEEKSEDGSPKIDRHAYAFFTCWTPESAIRKSKNASYGGWAQQGFITAMPGEVVNDEPVIDATLKDAARHDVTEVPFDPWSARQLANVLSDKNLTVVELRQVVSTFSEPMKTLLAMVLTKRFHHNAGPCVRWQMGNVVAHRDRNDNLFPNKAKPENKIDAAVALLMALNRALLAPPAPTSVYEERPSFLAF